MTCKKCASASQKGAKYLTHFAPSGVYSALWHGRYAAAKLASYFAGCLSAFELNNKFDVYVLCFSDHDDVAIRMVLLSMWRGYMALMEMAQH